jgi:aminoglycoside phosphotransferase (APT) family kinase protein
MHVRLSDGSRLSVIFKRLTNDVRPVHDGSRREVLVYRQLLAGERFGSPQVYASVYDEARGRFWLFLEDVGEHTLKHGGQEEWDAAVRLLAEIHAAYIGRDDALSRLNFLAEHNRAYYRSIRAGARQNMVRAGNGRALARFDELVRPFDTLVNQLIRQPRTLVHGDVYTSNFAIQPGPRIRLIDWESAGIGSPFLDLARLLDGWGMDKPSFVELYLAELKRRTSLAVDRQVSLRAFTACEVVSVLWNLRWSVEVCRDEMSVNELLDEIEALWARLEGMVGHE